MQFLKSPSTPGAGFRQEFQPCLGGRVSQARNRADASKHLPSFRNLRASSCRGCQEQPELLSPFRRFEFLRSFLAASTGSTVVETSQSIYPDNAVTPLIIVCTGLGGAMRQQGGDVVPRFRARCFYLSCFGWGTSIPSAVARSI
jgi:hypothetical protein